MGKRGSEGNLGKMNQMTFDQMKEEVDVWMKKKEEASASLQLSVSRSGATYQITTGDAKKVDLVRSLWGAPYIKENTTQLSARAIANDAAARVAADAATHEL